MHSKLGYFGSSGGAPWVSTTIKIAARNMHKIPSRTLGHGPDRHVCGEFRLSICFAKMRLLFRATARRRLVFRKHDGAGALSWHAFGYPLAAFLYV
jgi:hypothetical protein